MSELRVSGLGTQVVRRILRRSGIAKGVTFITLENMIGMINFVVWPDLKEKRQKVVMGARLMEVRSRIEYDDEVIHVIVHSNIDATHKLHALSHDLLKAPMAEADHVNTLLTGGGNWHFMA